MGMLNIFMANVDKRRKKKVDPLINTFFEKHDAKQKKRRYKKK